MPSSKSKPHKILSYLYGLDDSRIESSSLGVPIHQDVVEPFLRLKKAAEKKGFDLTIASAYRNFDRQLTIWNEKANGIRIVYDDYDQPIDMSMLTPWQQVQAILRWSALPGASRHHWGTDIDVYDKSAIASDYSLQLSAAEVSEGGPFWSMHQWLDEEIEAENEGFFRPYNQDRNGVYPERWHLSYAPLAAEYQSVTTAENLMFFLSDKPVALKEVVLENFTEIYQRFVVIPSDCYPSPFRSMI